jgi:outer membrane protein OmpA-like peptidoglycan-associated protein
MRTASLARPAIGLTLLTLLLTACGGTVTYGSGNLRIDLTRDRLVIHDHIRFGHDSAAILEESYPLLNAVVEVLRDNEGDVVAMQVHGHSSADGDDAHNLELSEARAAAVVAYLEEQGVTQDLSSRGFGEEHLLCREETDACHARNRRVEFIVSHR